MTYRGRTIDLSSIRHVALMTVEGEKDDISGVGQTEAAHRLCSQIPSSMRVHYVQPNVGHYGVFNGSRFATEIAPRIQAFIQDQEANRPQWDRTGLALSRGPLVREGSIGALSWGFHDGEDVSGSVQMKQGITARHHQIGANSHHPYGTVH